MGSLLKEYSLLTIFVISIDRDLNLPPKAVRMKKKYSVLMGLSIQRKNQTNKNQNSFRTSRKTCL